MDPNATVTIVMHYKMVNNNCCKLYIANGWHDIVGFNVPVDTL